MPACHNTAFSYRAGAGRFCGSLLACLSLAVHLFLPLCLVAKELAAPTEANAFLGSFTLKDERELGEKFNVLIRSRMPLVQDPEILGYVTGIVKKLEKGMPRQPFPFTVSVLRHNAVNAFACPGGYIFVHTGLLLAMNNESEVAGVIAHEMAHVSQRHIAQRIESGKYVSILSLLGVLAGAFLGGDAGAAVMTGSMAASQSAMLNYSRNDEREADQVGMNYLTKAGYAPQGMVGAFEVLSKRQWLVGSTVPAYLSTHPALMERVRDMGIRVSKLSAAERNKRDDNNKFLRVQALVRARFSDAQAAYQAFTRQQNSPSKCVAKMGLGILSSRQNKVADAARYFDEALACAPNDQLITREAGIFHYTKGNRNRGATLLSRAVSMNPNDVFALFYQARSLGDLGQTEKAINLATLVARKVPEDAEVHELLARLYADNGKMFSANLHMAYKSLFERNERRLRQFYEKAKPLAKTAADKTELARFDKKYKERKEFWK